MIDGYPASLLCTFSLFQVPPAMKKGLTPVLRRGEVVDISIKKTSRGLQQVYTRIDKSSIPERSNANSTSPRKRHKSSAVHNHNMDPPLPDFEDYVVSIDMPGPANVSFKVFYSSKNCFHYQLEIISRPLSIIFETGSRGGTLSSRKF